jgi:hypothetical protein
MENLNNIKSTITYKGVCNEARQTSYGMQTTTYVIYRNNSLITSLIKEKGTILTSFYLGNEIKN